MTCLSTLNVTPRDVIPFWKDVVCQTYVPIECDILTDCRFAASVRSADLVRAHLSRVRSMPIQYQRTKTNIADCGSDDYLVKLLTRGTAQFEQSGRSTLLGPGDLCLFDTARPYKLSFPTSYEAVMVKIPRLELESRLPNAENVAAMRVASEGQITRLAATMLTSTSEFLHEDDTPKRIAPNLIDLIALAFDECFNDLVPGDSRYAKIVSRAKDLIQQNLLDADFDVSGVAKTIGVSPRTLSRAFAQQGITPVKWMWGERLNAAREMLHARGTDSVSEVAMKCGFNDFSHFSRAFKARFGITASSVLIRK